MTTQDGLWVPARRAMTIGLVLLVTLVAFEALAVNTALPDASKELGGLGLYGWVFSGFMLATVASIAVSGRAIDRRGLHPVLAVGAPLFCVGLLIGATAPSMVVLVMGRIVQGLGAGAISSVANVSIGRAYPPKLRAAMLAVMSSSWVVPGMVGPGLSAVITETFGWRWVFAALIPIVGGAALLTLPALRPFGPTARADALNSHRTTDPLRVAIGFAFVIGGLSNAHDTWPLAFIAIGLVIAASSLRRLSPDGTFRLASGPPAAIVLNFLINFAFFSTDAFLPLAVKDVRDRGVGYAGLALTTGALSWTAGAWVVARLNAKVPVVLRVRVGFTFVALGVALVLFGLEPNVPIVIFPIAWFFAGLGMGLGYQSLVLVVLGTDEDADEDGPAGSLVAARQILDTLGTATGAGVAGACVAVATAGNHTTRSGLTVSFVIMLAVTAVGFSLSGRVRPTGAPVDATPATLP